MSDHENHELWDILFGRQPIAPEQAPEVLRRWRAEALVDEAEQAVHGIRHITIEHGHPLDADDEQRQGQLWRWTWDNGERAQISTRESNAATTWSISGHAADELVAELETLAGRLDPSWLVRRSAR